MGASFMLMGRFGGPDRPADLSHTGFRVLDGDYVCGCWLDGFGQVPGMVGEGGSNSIEAADVLLPLGQRAS
jgi:hypothetical protein